MHLDLFQRIHVDPCSVTAIRYTPTRPFVFRLGDTGDFGGSYAAPPPNRSPPTRTPRTPGTPSWGAARARRDRRAQ